MTPREIRRELNLMTNAFGPRAVYAQLAIWANAGPFDNPDAPPANLWIWVGRSSYSETDLFSGADEELRPLVDGAWRALALLDSRRIAMDECPGQGEFIRYAGRV